MNTTWKSNIDLLAIHHTNYLLLKQTQYSLIQQKQIALRHLTAIFRCTCWEKCIEVSGREIIKREESSLMKISTKVLSLRRFLLKENISEGWITAIFLRKSQTTNTQKVAVADRFSVSNLFYQGWWSRK